MSNKLNVKYFHDFKKKKRLGKKIKKKDFPKQHVLKNSNNSKKDLNNLLKFSHQELEKETEIPYTNIFPIVYEETEKLEIPYTNIFPIVYEETEKLEIKTQNTNSNSTNDCSMIIEDLNTQIKNESQEIFTNFNKYFMQLKPIKPFNTLNINLNFSNSLSDLNPVNFSSEKNTQKTNTLFSRQYNYNHISKIKISSSIFSKKNEAKESIPLEIYSDLYLELISEEINNPLCFGYKKNQKEINEKMRPILIDWLSEVHLAFKLVPEVLFLTVNIIDRFLHKQNIPNNQLQLLGVVALLIASKYEEITYPSIENLVFITKNTYSKNEIIEFELFILKTLNYEFTFPTVLIFFDLLALNFNMSEKEYFLGRYFCEIFLLDSNINKYSNSLVACAVGYLVLRINKFEDYRIINCFKYSSNKDLKTCAREICILVDNIDSYNLKSIKNKYAKEDFLEVSKFKFKN